MRIALITRNARLYTSRRLIQGIRSLGHDAIVVDPFRCVLQSNPLGIRHKLRPLPAIDAAIPRVGSMGFDVVVSVIRQFESLGIPVLNTSSSIHLARDKWATLQALSSRAIPTPETVYSVDPNSHSVILKRIGLPAVVKILDGSQGAGVMIAESSRSLAGIIDCLNATRTEFIVQRYIHEAAGEDIRCLVLNGAVVAAMKRRGKSGEFRSNLHRGGVPCIVEITDAERQLAIDAAEALGVNFAGVDILRSVSGPLVIEVNASPGLEGIESIASIDLAQCVASKTIDLISSN